MNNCRTNCIECLCRQVKALSCQSNSPISIKVGKTTTLPAGNQATVINVGTPTNVVLDFGIPKGADGSSTGLTNMHVWMESSSATITIPHSEDIFGVGTPKGIGFSSVQGSSIADFTVAGAAIKVNSPGTYLVTYQFVVKDTKCNVCIRRKSACVEGGSIQLTNPDGNILVSGAMVYIVSPEDITNTNGVFSIANADNTRPMPIDPNSFSWTVTQLNKTYNPIFKRIPFNQ
ncbi:MAG: hypothetical protein RSE25_04970 [Bacteroidales bacterium]